MAFMAARVETSIMLARYPQAVRKDKIADFHPSSIAMEEDYRWLSAHRPAPFAWQAQDLHPSGRRRRMPTQASAEKGHRCSTMARRHFANCLQTSTSSTWQGCRIGRQADAAG